ncbi:hypothetical protein AA80_01970 [Petrotoga sibirica DSM 13575]|uniref:Nickel-dependent lactate racemase n=3 Tax=Petrotogaceae TaxID=1643949 RepID=A0A4R8EL70_9BACT|nr:nickel-dependent lactate racemase [Petrotoga sibirica]POZ89201.1 hypothetical protein AA80_01970 [Petrotoga sibirica DSM 13575]POZ91505.1 hypothetical protein AD60_01685 [Petrotoga sp. SL27]TDX12864.1 nickel-dependent lactate racemase [Petrotoga sibirica]
MAEIIVPFGKDNIKISNIKDFDIIDVGEKRNTSLSYQQMKEKIDKFIDGISFQGMKNIAVAIPDITRPRVPIEIFQHILKRFLSSFQGNIKIFVGTGLHNYRLSDKNELIPENLVHNDKVQVFFHDARSEFNIYVGETKPGTPVFIEKDYLLSDLKISIGIVEPHQFAGFSGGAKGVVIGLGGEKTISKNHSLLIDPNSKTGLLEGNPIREDIEEAGKMIKIDYLINFVMNANNVPMEIFCGKNPESYLKAVEYLKDLVGYKIDKTYDMVITSPGGFPRDIDLYQAQKALTPATSFCKDNGIILLLAECSRGAGEENYIELIKRFKTPEKVIKNFDFDHFAVGPHKALIFAKAALNNKLFLYSTNKQLTKELKRTFINPIEDLQVFLKKEGETKSIGILPRALQLLPL